MEAYHRSTGCLRRDSNSVGRVPSPAVDPIMEYALTYHARHGVGRRSKSMTVAPIIPGKMGLPTEWE